jgi:hypothetical protein
MLLVVCLLGGTAAAFAVTEGLKLEKSPILAPRIDKVFSPVCDCRTRVADITFRLRKPDKVRLDIVRDGTVVRTLVNGRRLRRGTVHYTWNGRDDQGRFVPQGTYKPRVHLTDQHRTIELPNDMRVDTTAPGVRLTGKQPGSISPDGDGRNDQAVLHYRLTERAHAILLVNGSRYLFTRRQLPSGSVTWNGKLSGKAVAPGTYSLQLEAQDPAGNVSEPTPAQVVYVRYIELARPLIRVKAGTRFGVRVSTDARSFRWRLGKRTGTAKAGLLVLRAPGHRGRLPLVVEEHGHSARALVVMRPAR